MHQDFSQLFIWSKDSTKTCLSDTRLWTLSHLNIDYGCNCLDPQFQFCSNNCDVKQRYNKRTEDERQINQVASSMSQSSGNHWDNWRVDESTDPSIKDYRGIYADRQVQAVMHGWIRRVTDSPSAGKAQKSHQAEKTQQKHLPNHQQWHHLPTQEPTWPPLTSALKRQERGQLQSYRRWDSARVLDSDGLRHHGCSLQSKNGRVLH